MSIIDNIIGIVFIAASLVAILVFSDSVKGLIFLGLAKLNFIHADLRDK